MSGPTWVDTVSVDGLPHGEVIGVEVAGRDIAIYSIDGEIYATDNLCTHGQARLCDGFLGGHAIECPLHQGQFDVRDGKPLCGPVTVPLRTYRVRVDGSRVLVQVGDST
jgi:naphthalene 1,2-dioxygenase ferredoxin component